MTDQPPSIRRLEDGRLTEVITARPPLDQADVLALAARYRRGAVPGVVSVVSFRGDPDPVLVLALPGDESWATLPPAIAGLGAAGARVAVTLAQLHERGVVHGALSPDAVIVDPRGAPVLRGLSAGGQSTQGDDVRAFAGVLAQLARASTSRSAAEAHDRQALIALCDRVGAAADPLASTLAARLTALGRQRGPYRRASVRVVAVALGLLGCWLLRDRPATPTSSTASPVSSTRAPTSSVPPSSAGRTTTVIVAPATTAGPGRAATTTTLGPPSRVPIPTTTFSFDGRRWTAGQAGDEVVVIDWQCRGRPAAVAARPRTGEVFLWRGWPVGGSEAGERIGVVPALTGFAEPPVPRCGVIAVDAIGGPIRLRPGDQP